MKASEEVSGDASSETISDSVESNAFRKRFRAFEDTPETWELKVDKTLDNGGNEIDATGALLIQGRRPVDIHGSVCAEQEVRPLKRRRNAITQTSRTLRLVRNARDGADVEDKAFQEGGSFFCSLWRALISFFAHISFFVVLCVCVLPGRELSSEERDLCGLHSQFVVLGSSAKENEKSCVDPMVPSDHENEFCQQKAPETPRN